ncbi:PaaI family thioesterase [Microbacterium invictum]|uniref:Uncharacterized protein (TIGR00369 family) n=2 Tax=Microbacterium invictum TaxID=515415 RepID=A0AA40VLX4_9MICO|nr:PaaI family thioesterase [Microbacterium invictum]MBB4138723.1 uncharacterized protein (TIGR00369 family) [Microbacterium invictum]
MSFAKQGLMSTLGARLGHTAPGEVHIHLPMSNAVTQQHGLFHGGATSTIADSAGGYAALTLMDPASEVLTVEYKINLLAPAIGDELEAIGTVIKPGRTLTICRLDVYAHNGGQRTLVAAGQQTLIRVDAPLPHGSSDARPVACVAHGPRSTLRPRLQ